MSDTSLPTRPSQVSHQPLLSAVRLVLTALFIVVVAIAILSLPTTFSAVQSDWQFSQAVASAGALMPYNVLVALISAIELTLLGLFLATAALLLLQRPLVTTLVGALTMMTLPFAIGLGGLGAPLSLSGPIGTSLSSLMGILAAVGVPLLLIIAFIFPDGRFEPRWLAVLPVLVLIGFVLITRIPNLDESGWFVFMALLMATLLAAILGQLVHFRRADVVRRSQTMWFLVAMVALAVMLVLSSFATASTLALLLGYLPYALLPVAFIVAAWRGVWGDPVSSRQRSTFLAAIGLLGMTSLAGSAAWLQQNQPVVLDVGGLATEQPVPLVLDVDMAMDDITALLYVLQHPAADLRAITVNGVAFAHCDGGVHAALGLLELAKAPDIPVACGRETAYPGGVPAPEAWRRSADKLYGAAILTGGRTEDSRGAAELLADVIHSSPGEITILAVGPLTNLAEAFEADPTLPALIKQVVIMGGAVDVPGNVANEDEGIDNQFAEWNFYADPIAADRVMDSGVPILLIPLDATNDVPFSRGFHQKLSAEHLTKPATFTYNLFYLNPYWLDGGMYWWDTLAVAAGLDNSLITRENANIDVITEDGPEFGRTIRTQDGAPVELATAADARRFEALLLALLNLGHP